MSEIVNMTYTRVASDAAPGEMMPREHDDKVDAFLLDHVRALVASAASDDAPIALFFEPAAQALFESVRTGDQAAFLDAAGQLARRLVGEMDGRSGPGLLVCVQISDGQEMSGAALKLEVVAPNSAVLEALESGEEVLSGATNVLDAPGKLQKGALVRDPRAASDVVIGDKLYRDAAYFPRAFGIRPEQRSADTAADLINSIAAVAPVAARQAARVLSEITPGSAEEVLEALAERVPPLDLDARDAVLGRLSAGARPVRNVDTSGTVRETLTADGVTISGTASAMRAVEYSRDPQGDGWLITVRVRDEPRRSFKR